MKFIAKTTIHYKHYDIAAELAIETVSATAAGLIASRVLAWSDKWYDPISVSPADEDNPVGECAHCHKLVYSDWADLPNCENCGQPLIIIPTD